MEQKTSNFQIAVLLIFGFFVFLGVILFSSSKLSPKNSNGVSITPVIVWGTIPSALVNKYITDLLEEDKESLKMTYVEKEPKTYEKELIEAIADGAGPDIVILPQDLLFRNVNKFAILPFASYPLRSFKDQFIDSGSVYLKSDGIVAVPFIVDPLVMYWNKTNFVNVGVVNPPKEWDEFSEVVAKLTKKDLNFNIIQSGTALGEYQNVDHAKDILSMFFLQAGVPIVKKGEDDTYSTSLLFNSKNSESPAVSALSFYTNFANPTKDSYSWNKSLKSSFLSFISGDTSIYFGFASELSTISLKNPNLNFDVAKIPQIPNTSQKSVFARLYGLAVLKSSKSQVSAFNQIYTLTSKKGISMLSQIMNLPPVRKDVLVDSSSDLYMQTFYDSALYSSTFADPNASETELLYKNMIESVIKGQTTPETAIGMTERELNNIIRSNSKAK